jgi:hypothetical protein
MEVASGACRHVTQYVANWLIQGSGSPCGSTQRLVEDHEVKRLGCATTNIKCLSTIYWTLASPKFVRISD